MKQLRDDRGRPLHVSQLYPLLGLKPGQHLPKDGTMVITRLGDTDVTILAKGPEETNRRHRVIARCNLCSKWFPFGRLAQHQKRRDHQ